jgi:hypothetical protein
MKLHDTDKEPLWVDVDKVMTMRRIEGAVSYTVLQLTETFSWNVLETPEELARWR